MTNKEFNEFFRKRTKKYALDIIKFLEEIPFNAATRIMSYQLGKARTSVGANFVHFAEADPKTKDFLKYVLLRKKQMKLYIGLTYSMNRTTDQRKN